MKKMILMLCCLLLTGCYNYLELNDIAIVSYLAVDYQNNEYNLTAEIKENQKEDESASLIYKASSSSLEGALQEMALSVNKELYLIDLNVLILSTEAVNEKLDSILDYLTRDSRVGSYFNIIIDDDIDKTTDMIKEKKKIVGDYIKNILTDENNNSINVNIEDFVKSYLSDTKDIILPYGKVTDDDYVIDSAVIFSNNKICDTIYLDMIESYNLLSNNKPLYLYEIYDDEKQLIYKVKESKTEIKYEDEMIKIIVKVNGSFNEMEDVNLNDEDKQKELIDLVDSKIKEEIEKFMDELVSNDSDVLGLKKIIYNKERVKPKTISNLKYEVKIESKLDREGLIFNSIGDER